MRIALVAGEASGDILGAGLIRAIGEQHPDVTFEGIGGPLMLAEGMRSEVAMERLSVMGLVEVLGRLRELLGIRRTLAQKWLANPPDLFIGIDAPDFNLSLERTLREGGVPTVHYVSPSVWAWRRGRLKGIARSTDLMLCLFPFETHFYAEAGIDARFVGHTLADQLPLEPDVAGARARLGITDNEPRVALLPGSRGGEVKLLAPLFLQAAKACLAAKPGLRFLLPAANDSRYEQLAALLTTMRLPVQLLRGQSRDAMLACDAVLMASGTAALEGMLLKKPLVVAYKMAPLSYAIISRLLNVPYVSLPNLLADAPLIPELLQDQATPDALAKALLKQLDDGAHRQALCQRFSELHQQLRRDASHEAAKAVLELVQTKSASSRRS